MTVTKQFVVLLLLAFGVALGFTIQLTSRFSRFSTQGTQLTEGLQKTLALSQELLTGAAEETSLLYGQFGELDPQFTTKLDEINFQLGETILKYLRLDLGENERLAVERIRELYSELGIQSRQIYEQLRHGERRQALQRVKQAEGLKGRIDKEFATLNDLQVRKLEQMLLQSNRAVKYGFIAIYGFADLLLIMLIAFMLLLRKRILVPLHSVLEAIDRIRRGDFSARAPVGRLDESGVLAQGFNFMAESLAESYKGLERKVEERTQQLRELRIQFVQAEKMSAMGRLVGGVAHELNNPLTVILGFTEMEIKKLTARHADPKTIKLMEDIYFQAERCRRIVANLLQVARRQEPHLEPIRINGVIEQVLQLRDYELSTRNIRMARKYDSTDPLIQADPHKMQQVVLNILNNAIDAIQESGREGIIQVRTKLEGDKFILEFSDNGTGIVDPDRIFDPFYTTKEVGKGTGLGLSVCYGIVQEHGGEILAENLEQGARFVITLPVGKVGIPPEEKGARPSAGMGGEKHIGNALLVDDEESLLELQISILSRIGVEAHGVSSGEEAVRFLQTSPVDLIVSDVRMPGSIDGPRLYEWVCIHRPELRKRFVFISGDVLAMQRGEISSLREVPTIQKPFQIEDYLRLMQQLLKT
ncbi:MAG: ATP-binding protein [Terriglobia bacterium]